MKWMSISKDGYPDYYTLVWVSNGIDVVLAMLLGGTYAPKRTIWENRNRGGPRGS